MRPLTLDRETYLRLVAAWSDFGPEWAEAKKLCAERGYPFPPVGHAWDDREDTEPSQRAIVWRALDYRRERTLDVIGHSRSWSEVVRKVIGDEERLREDADFRERDAEWDKDGQPNPGEALQTFAALVRKVQDS